MNFQTATHKELVQEGYTVTKLRSQIVSRRRKSLFGVRPSINNSNHNSAKPMKSADQVGTGKIRG
jgi:hypothetical protein